MLKILANIQIILTFADVNEREGQRRSSFLFGRTAKYQHCLYAALRHVITHNMDRVKFQNVVDKAVSERGCSLVDVLWNDDDNVFEIIITKADGSQVQIADCEYVHRAVLSEFDRNIEDYALTVGSAGMSGEEADELLQTIEE